jgi:hypothetical protein
MCLHSSHFWSWTSPVHYLGRSAFPPFQARHFVHLLINPGIFHCPLFFQQVYIYVCKLFFKAVSGHNIVFEATERSLSVVILFFGQFPLVVKRSGSWSSGTPRVPLLCSLILLYINSYIVGSRLVVQHMHPHWLTITLQMKGRWESNIRVLSGISFTLTLQRHNTENSKQTIP